MGSSALAASLISDITYSKAFHKALASYKSAFFINHAITSDNMLAPSVLSISYQSEAPLDILVMPGDHNRLQSFRLPASKEKTVASVKLKPMDPTSRVKVLGQQAALVDGPEWSTANSCHPMYMSVQLHAEEIFKVL